MRNSTSTSRSSLEAVTFGFGGRYWLAALLAALSLTARAQEPKTLEVDPDTPKDRLILIGDAGALDEHGRLAVIDAAARTFDLDDPAAMVVYLGDNVYPRGLPDSEDPDYDRAYEVLRQQAGLVMGKAAPALWIPGNHDWDRFGVRGWEAILRQAAMIDSLRQPNLYLQPRKGCPGPVDIPLSEDWVLIVIDSQWWLHPFAKPGEDSNCRIKTKQDVAFALASLAYQYRDHSVVVALHHPIRTHGVHGGYFKLKQHLFPLTDVVHGLYLPLPVIGSLYPIVRGTFGPPQDLSHPDYKLLSQMLTETFADHPRTVFTSGHEHTLQLIRDDSLYFIVSGSGSKEDRVRYGKNTLYATHERGCAVLERTADDQMRCTYYVVSGDTLRQTHTQLLFDFPEPWEMTPDTTAPEAAVAAPAPHYADRKRRHRFWFGNNYRATWAAADTFPTLDLRADMGGLRVEKRGGGMQTRSLRLVDSSGTEYSLRSVEKYPARAVPDFLKETVAEAVVQDQISASHPYAALTVPPLAEAAGIPHLDPQVVYLPRNDVLGRQTGFVGDALYLLEYREPPGLGDTDGTDDILEEIADDNDHVVNQRAVLKARLLDLFIGDWDRHDDQWRWAEVDTGRGKTYYPVPRDRDQVYFVNDGVLPKIASRNWLLPKIQGFRSQLRDVRTFNYNARKFDRTFLTELTREDWAAAADTFLTQMTDSVLREAVRRLPPGAYALRGEQLYETLRARRRYLKAEALDYYDFLSEAVDVPGSDKKDVFEIEKYPDGRVRVTAYDMEDGEPGLCFYDRTFLPQETKEIRVYSRGNEDRFVLRGTERSPIRVRLVGSKKEDIFVDETEEKGRGIRYVIHDLRAEGNEYPSLSVARRDIARRGKYRVRYRRDFRYDVLAPLATAGFNPDDGVLLGAGLLYTKHRFWRDPYAARHRLTALQALSTRAFSARYEGHFVDVFGHSDLELVGEMWAPNYTINYFGFGNESVFNQDEFDFRYYRARFNQYRTQANVVLPTARELKLYGGLFWQHFNLDADRNEDKFVGEQIASGELTDVTAPRSYVGAAVGLEFDTRDDEIFPMRGVVLRTQLAAHRALRDGQDDYLTAEGEFTFFLSTSARRRWSLMNRTGVSHIEGDYVFYQAPTLGGVRTFLRGFRNHRFTGQTALYHNIEGRLRLFEFSSVVVPGRVGLLGFYDTGRVWAPDENSDRWHHGYGVGLYISPARVFTFNVVVGMSREEVLPYAYFGFRF